MKAILCTATLLSILTISPLPAQQPAPAVPAEDLIKETTIKVLQRHLETAMTDKLEIQKQLLSAPADEQTALQNKAAALTKCIAEVERELTQLSPPTPAPAPAPPVKPSPAELLARVKTSAGKADSMERALRDSIISARLKASKELTQQAASAEAAASAALLMEARRLELILPETPLPPSQEMQSLAGLWEHGLAPYRQGSFTPGGLIVMPDGTPHGTWSWLDEGQKIFFVDDDSKWMNLCRIKDANTIESVVIDGSQFKYTRKSSIPAAGPPLPAACNVLADLAAVEKTLRDDAAAAWQKEKDTVVALLESALPDLPKPNKTTLTGTIEELRTKKIFQVRTEPTEKLAGKWVVDGLVLEFLSGGVVRVNGEPKGKWLWGKKRSKGHVVFTLGPGGLTAIGNFGGGPMELQIIGSTPKHAMKL